MFLNILLVSEKGDPEQPPSVRSLKYDQKSKRYMFSDDALDVKSCSICLEDLGKWTAVMACFCADVLWCVTARCADDEYLTLSVVFMVRRIARRHCFRFVLSYLSPSLYSELVETGS